MNHPPHLTSSWSSAFIPFCAYKINLNFSKNPFELPGIAFPLCSSFLPTILEGQRCYKLKLNDTSGEGKKNELMLPHVLPAFFNKIGFFVGLALKKLNCAVIFCHGRVLKGEITSPIYLSPTQAVQGDNPIVKK